ncbi:MAG: hypothetical protein SFU25_02155, partial [Candidatus Caenarcaniphilales bacterium]|nr:hypothetical protein [Candidatus Caenarcaniphilales bacterium]
MNSILPTAASRIINVPFQSSIQGASLNSAYSGSLQSIYSPTVPQPATTNPSTSDDKNFWRDFWDWKGTLVSLAALVGGGLAATALYKPIAKTGIGNYLPFKEFYTEKRDGCINELKKLIDLDSFGLSENNVR